MSTTNVIALVVLIALLLIFFSVSIEIRTTREVDRNEDDCAATGDNTARTLRDVSAFTRWNQQEGFTGQYDGEFH